MQQPGFRFGKAHANDGVAEQMGMLAARTIAGEKAYYENLWGKLQVRPDWVLTVNRYVNYVIVTNRSRYEAVGKLAGNTPWFVVAILHAMEASSDFSSHLHNGDPLTRRTFHVPAGRPAEGEPPFTWEESAVDALKGDGLGEQEDWSLAGICFALEAFNGFGYRPRNIVSPYLAAQSNLWTRGKFVEDGHFDPNAGSSQIGALVFLQALVNQGTVKLEHAPATQPTPQTGEFPELARGSIGPWVRVLQHTLNGCGYGPLTLDGDFGQATDGEVREFQRGVGLEVDGVVGPRTWGALNRHAKLPGWVTLGNTPSPVPGAGLRSRVASQAKAWASQGRSQSPGSWIDVHVLDPLRPAMIDLGHWPKGADDGFWNWCAAWVTAVLRECGLAVPDRFNGEWATVALVDAWRGWAKRNGCWIPKGAAQPVLGDVVIYDWDGDTASDHIGIVLSSNADGVVSCEGNSREVEAIRSRPWSSVQGFVSLEGLASRLS